MVKLIVEITSKDMIRPSSRTPNHLKTLQFSFQDQLSPSALMPFVFFYQNYGGNYSETIKLLKESLSRTLVQFYPFAGRIEDLWIDCNDEGVPFYEANVVATLAQIMGNPNNSEELLSLLPFAPYSTNHASKRIVAGIQVNRFSCKGVALAFSISHKIADAATYVAFVSAWAKKTRGDTNNDDATQIKFVGTSLFPQMTVDGLELPRKKIVTKRVLFNKEMIDMLKKRSVGRVQGNRPTRVEVVSAFLWKQFIKVSRTKPRPIKISAAVQAVNLRTVKSSTIPKNSCGNIYTLTIAYARVDTEIEYPEAVQRLREAVKRTRKSSYYSETMRTGKYILERKEAYQKIFEQGGHFCFFSDLTKFPVYEVNFGWGRPMWVSQGELPFKNTVIFMRTKDGEAIEAWMYIPQQDVAAFEEDHEFVSLTPPDILAKL